MAYNILEEYCSSLTRAFFNNLPGPRRQLAAPDLLRGHGI